MLPSSADIRAISCLIQREWQRVLKEPSRVASIVVQPMVFWLVIGGGFVPSFRLSSDSSIDYQSYFFPGVLALVILFSAIFATITLIDDRHAGFLQTVLVSPASRSAIVVGKIAAVVSVTLVQTALFFVILPFSALQWSHIQWPWLFLFVFLGAFGLSGLGFVFAWLSPSTSAYHALMSVILIPMWILSGAMFPLENTWMAPLQYINPTSYLVEGLRSALFAQSFPMGAFGALSVFCFVMVSLGVYVCQRQR